MDFIELREAISLKYSKERESLVLGKAGAVLKQSFPDVAIDEEKIKTMVFAGTDSTFRG